MSPAAGEGAGLPPGVTPRIRHHTACGHHLAYTQQRRCQVTNVPKTRCYLSQRLAPRVGFAAEARRCRSFPLISPNYTAAHWRTGQRRAPPVLHDLDHLRRWSIASHGTACGDPGATSGGTQSARLPSAVGCAPPAHPGLRRRLRLDWRRADGQPASGAVLRQLDLHLGLADRLDAGVSLAWLLPRRPPCRPPSRSPPCSTPSPSLPRSRSAPSRSCRDRCSRVAGSVSRARRRSLLRVAGRHAAPPGAAGDASRLHLAVCRPAHADQTSPSAGQTAGSLYALSTVGSIAGSFVPVLLLIPLIGTAATFVVLCLALLIPSLAGLASPRSWPVVAAAALGALAVPGSPWRRQRRPPPRPRHAPSRTGVRLQLHSGRG